MLRERRGAVGCLMAIALTLGMSGCRKADDPEVVARWGDSTLTRSELAECEDALPAPAKRRLPGESAETQQQRLLQRCVVDRIARGRAEGISATALPEEVTTEVEDAERRLLEERIEQDLVAPRIEVTEEEARRHYDENPDLFGHQGRIRLRHIFRRVARDADPATRRAARLEMEELRRQLLDGANFEDMARSTSDSETASLGGLIGLLDPGALEAPLEAKVWNLDEGEISEVISTPVGFHVFRLDKRIPGAHTTYEEAKSRIIRRLTKRKSERVHAEVLEELARASGAELHPEAIRGGDPEALVFRLGDQSLTVRRWRDGLSRQAFFKARELPEEDLVRNWARAQLYAWEAKRRGLDEDPAVVAQVEEVRRNRLIDWAWKDARQRAIEELPEGVLADYFEAEGERLRTPRLFDLSLIVRLFPKDEDAWYGVYEELAAEAEALRSGAADFAERARSISDDFTAQFDGHAGPIRLDSFSEWAGPQAQGRVAELTVGEVSDPILIERYEPEQLVYQRAGYMLVLVNAVQESRSVDLAGSRDRLVERLMTDAPPETEKRIRERILADAGAELYPENL